MSLNYRTILKPLRSYGGALRLEMQEPGGQNAVAAVAMCLQALATIWIIDTITSSGSLATKLLLFGLLWLAALVNWKPPEILTEQFVHVKREVMSFAYLLFLAPVLSAYLIFIH